MTGKNLGTDLGTTGGQWLFRQGELVLGPLPAHRLVEKLYEGDLRGTSEICLLGDGHFMRLSEVEFFKVHLAKAEAKLRVEALAQAENARRNRQRNLRLAVAGMIALVLAIGAGALARWLAIHNPWKSGDEAAFGAISVEPPTIALAQARGNEELVDYPGAAHRAAQRRAIERSHGSSSKAERSSKAQDEEPDGLKTGQFDRESINATVAAKQKTLYSCVAEELRKRPGLNAKIPIEFVIGNDGRVGKLWVDHPMFKEGSLPECLLRELGKWSFKAYPGEQATVAFSFNVGKGG